MPRYDSFIGKLKTPGFYWKDIPDDRFRTGNQPARLVPTEWFESLGMAPYFTEKKIEEDGFEGRQIDWGSWAIIVRKSDCAEIWSNRDFARDAQRWDKISKEIDALAEDEEYLLVVTELP